MWLVSSNAMSNHAEHHTDAESDKAAEVRAYEVPNLTVLGEVTELTEACQISCPAIP